MTRGAATLLAALLATILAACGGGSDVAGLPAVQEVVVTGEAQLPLDATTRLQATLRGADGAAIEGRPIYWSTSDPAIATVDQTGLVTPKAIGRVQVAASADGRSGVLAVEVVRKRVRTIDLVVAAAEVAVGDTVAAQATVRAADGGDVPGITPSFSSTAPEIASVTSDGRVVGRATGTVGIVASADGVADTTSVSVVPARVGGVLVEPESFELTVGRSLPLRVTVRDRTGAPLAGRTVAYASSAAGVASVDAAGIVRAVSPGAATITASSGGASAIARVTVVPEPAPPPPAPVPATLTIAPNAVSLQVGTTQALAATLRDTDGAIVTGRPVTWQSSATSVATVSASGVVTAVAPGATVITASAAGITGTAGVTVTNVPVATVVVSPSEVALKVGETRDLSATPRSASDAALTGRVVTWSTSAASVATVSSTGEVRAVGAGTATITAASEGRTGTARVTVTAAAPGPAVRFEKVSGDGQRGDADKELRNPLVARVVDASGRPVPGVTVRWMTTDGGRFTPEFTVSDADGLVSTRWRLGKREGTQRATLHAIGFEPLPFTATAEDD